MNKDILVRKVKSLYNEYRLYSKYFEQDVKNLETKKQDIAKSIEEGNSFEKHEAEMEFYLFGYQEKIKDVHGIVNELVALYKLMEAYELTDELEEEDKEVIVKLKSNKKLSTFIPTDKGLKERVEGYQKENVENIKSSEHYQKIMKMLKSEIVQQ